MCQKRYKKGMHDRIPSVLAYLEHSYFALRSLQALPSSVLLARCLRLWHHLDRFLGAPGLAHPAADALLLVTTWTERTSPEIAFTGQTFSQTSMPTHFAGSMYAFGRTGM